MAYTYAKIDNSQNPSVIVNIQIINEEDFLDPAFDWVNIEGLLPFPKIGWTYSEGVFSKPGLPNDVYDRAVYFSTNNVVDTYTTDSGKFNFPAGTPIQVVYLSLAIKENLRLFQAELQLFINNKYTIDTRFNLMSVYVNAQLNNLTDRMAYISQLFIWSNSIIVYCANYQAALMAITDPNVVLNTVPDLTSLDASDPKVSAFAALQILT